MDCPDPLTLAAYRDGGLEPSGREAFEAHASLCPLCRERLLTLAEPRVIRHRGWLAAAGILLLAGGAVWLSRSRPPVPASLPAPSPSVPGVLLLADAGARVSRLEGRRARLESGTCWLDVTGGEPAVLEIPSGTVTVNRGSIAASTTSRPFAFLSSAWAGEAEDELVVLWGEAELVSGGKRRKLEAGRRLVGDRLEAAPPEQVAALRRGRASALAARPGSPPGPQTPVPPAYRWVVLIEGRGPNTEVELTFGSGGGWRRWTVGLAARPPAASELLELVYDGEGVVGLVEGIPAFRLERPRLEAVQASSGPGWAVRTWGGAVAVKRSMLQGAP